MSLDNVYYWNEDGWKKITAEEFVKKHPDIKISAKDKYFWCEMCGQYVGLANGEFNKPHFRHYSAELKKDCDDRAKNFSKSDWIKSLQPSYDLPLKICVEDDNFHFKIGLIRLPQEIFDEVKHCRIKIQSEDKILCYSDLADYLLEAETTWLDVGNSPAQGYSLTLEPENSEVNFYWSRKFDGVNSHGTLFDLNTGRKILNDADVKVNSKYYLLTNQCVRPLKDVVVEKVFIKKIFRYYWALYEVEATALSEDAAKFFLDYHCRLTAKPILISPIYPVHTQDDEIICCDAENIFVYFSGNAKIRFFPQTVNSILLEEKNSKLIKVFCNERQKMVAAGRSQILQYFCIWKNLPNFEIKFPEIEVKDCNEKIISSGIYHTLPKNSILQVYSAFDGQVIVSKNSIVANKFFIKAETIYDVDDINFGTEIKIFQGLDCVFKVVYQREKKGFAQSDIELFSRLERGKGKKIKVPHTWGSLADKLRNYPKVRDWLYKNIRAGFVNEESYLIFRQFILEEL